MTTRHLTKRRLRIEELEGRLVMSAIPGLQGSAGLAGDHPASAVAPSVIQGHTPGPEVPNAGPSAIHARESTSSNWAGYAVETNLRKPQARAVTDVKGSWVVPSVTGTGNMWSSFWVGIDGYSSNTVEQIGTDSDISSGTAVYYAWYEMYPKYPVTITSVPIHAGDAIQAEVSYVGSSNFSLSITDTTTGNSFSTVQRSPQAKRSSAEWIAEAPSSSGGVLPLANFGTVYFTDASATLKGHQGPINDPLWQYDRIDMGSRSVLKAQTSALSNLGTSFSVTWLQATLAPRMSSAPVLVASTQSPLSADPPSCDTTLAEKHPTSPLASSSLQTVVEAGLPKVATPRLAGAADQTPSLVDRSLTELSARNLKVDAAWDELLRT